MMSEHLVDRGLWEKWHGPDPHYGETLRCCQCGDMHTVGADAQFEDGETCYCTWCNYHTNDYFLPMLTPESWPGENEADDE